MATLTPREKEVCTLVLSGNSYETIARTLGISVQRIRNMMSAIFRRFEVRDKTDLILLFMHTEGGIEAIPIRGENPG